MSVKLNLIVIRVSDLNKALEFYNTFGLTFVEEKHERGPLHYSANINGMIFELYPLKGAHHSHNVRLGFTVDNLQETVDNLTKVGATVITKPKTTRWGLAAVVKDPDQHIIEIYQT